jgi:hypothetical protein
MERMRVSFEVDTCRKDSRTRRRSAVSNPKTGGSPVQVQVLPSAHTMVLHRLLDPLWQQKGMKRQEVYKELSRRLGIAEKDCHVGEFDVEWCRAACRVLRAMHKELWEVSHERDESSDEVNYDKPKLTR